MVSYDKKPKIKIIAQSKELGVVPSFNTIAEIKGVEKPNEYVVLSAHFDSWDGGQGATDNGTGTLTMMEAMRILKASGLKPKRTIRIGLWSGEEQGLLGSSAYVEKHFAELPPPADPKLKDLPRSLQEAPLPPVYKADYKRISAYYNYDNGGGRIRGIYLQGNETLRGVFREWLKPLRDLGAETVTLSRTGSTDHVSFDNIGLPGFQFIQDEIEYDTRTHHTNMDTYDHLVPGDLMQAATIVASFVYNTATREEKIPRKTLPKPRGTGTRGF